MWPYSPVKWRNRNWGKKRVSGNERNARWCDEKKSLIKLQLNGNECICENLCSVPGTFDSRHSGVVARSNFLIVVGKLVDLVRESQRFIKSFKRQIESKARKGPFLGMTGVVTRRTPKTEPGVGKEGKAKPMRKKRKIGPVRKEVNCASGRQEQEKTQRYIQI